MKRKGERKKIRETDRYKAQRARVRERERERENLTAKKKKERIKKLEEEATKR